MQDPRPALSRDSTTMSSDVEIPGGSQPRNRTTASSVPDQFWGFDPLPDAEHVGQSRYYSELLRQRSAMNGLVSDDAPSKHSHQHASFGHSQNGSSHSSHSTYRAPMSEQRSVPVRREGDFMHDPPPDRHLKAWIERNVASQQSTHTRPEVCRQQSSLADATRNIQHAVNIPVRTVTPQRQDDEMQTDSDSGHGR